MRPVSIIQRYEVAPDSSVKVTLYTVPPAQTFTFKEVTVDFPVGTDNLLEVKFYRNEIPILPSDPSQVIVGENTTLHFKELPQLVSGENLIVSLKNNSTTESKWCLIKVEGEEK